jgi:hypothetical protein
MDTVEAPGSADSLPPGTDLGNPLAGLAGMYCPHTHALMTSSSCIPQATRICSLSDAAHTSLLGN